MIVEAGSAALALALSACAPDAPGAGSGGGGGPASGPGEGASSASGSADPTEPVNTAQRDSRAEVAELEGLDEETAAALVRRLRGELAATRSLGVSLPKLETEATPAQAYRAQATENAWRDIAREFGLLTATEVAERVGGTASAGRTYASDARRNGRLLGVRRLNHVLCPGFPFGPEGPLPMIRDLRSAADELEIEEPTVLLWLTAPTTWWGDDARPVDHLDDSDGVLSAFRSHFGITW